MSKTTKTTTTTRRARARKSRANDATTTNDAIVRTTRVRGVGARIDALIASGANDETIFETIAREYPASKFNENRESHVRWYRNRAFRRAIALYVRANRLRSNVVCVPQPSDQAQISNLLLTQLCVSVFEASAPRLPETAPRRAQAEALEIEDLLARGGDEVARDVPWGRSERARGVRVRSHHRVDLGAVTERRTEGGFQSRS